MHSYCAAAHTPQLSAIPAFVCLLCNAMGNAQHAPRCNATAAARTAGVACPPPDDDALHEWLVNSSWSTYVFRQSPGRWARRTRQCTTSTLTSCNRPASSRWVTRAWIVVDAHAHTTTHTCHVSAEPKLGHMHVCKTAAVENSQPRQQTHLPLSTRAFAQRHIKTNANGLVDLLVCGGLDGMDGVGRTDGRTDGRMDLSLIHI